MDPYCVCINISVESLSFAFCTDSETKATVMAKEQDLHCISFLWVFS